MLGFLTGKLAVHANSEFYRISFSCIMWGMVFVCFFVDSIVCCCFLFVVCVCSFAVCFVLCGASSSLLVCAYSPACFFVFVFGNQRGHTPP